MSIAVRVSKHGIVLETRTSREHVTREDRDSLLFWLMKPLKEESKRREHELGEQANRGMMEGSWSSCPFPFLLVSCRSASPAGSRRDMFPAYPFV